MNLVISEKSSELRTEKSLHFLFVFHVLYTAKQASDRPQHTNCFLFVKNVPLENEWESMLSFDDR
jgi:hypothetical protein